MVNCPICGSAIQPDQTACADCGLPMDLFEAFSELAYPANPDRPRADIAALPDSVASTRPETPVPGPRDSPEKPLTREAPGSIPEVESAELPRVTYSVPQATSPGTPSPIVVEPLIQPQFPEVSSGQADRPPLETRAQLARRRRQLISSILDALMNRYRRLCERRDVFSSVIRTESLDAELAGYRRALAHGEIAEAEEHRRNAQEMLESVEKDWARISFQITEANQMVRALRELGGVAPSVLRPIAAAVRVPRRAEAAQIEQRLDNANGLLWRLLVPRMEHEVSKYRSALHKVRAPPTRVAPVQLELARMDEYVRTQKVGEALDSRRFVRSELAVLLPRATRRAPTNFSIDEAHPS